MTSAVEDLGPHLLKRLPSKPDPRDFELAWFLTGDPLRAALRSLQRSALVAHPVKSWAALVTNAIDPIVPAPPGPTPPTPPSPTPTPTPPAPTPPAPASANWLDEGQPVLDQGQTGHCVGFTGADWENALPVDDHVDNAMGDTLYYACKVVDREPGQEDGSSVKSLMQVLQARKRLKTYASAGSIDEVKQFVLKSGPICWGIGWTNSMFTPDADGLVVPQGSDVGGHAIIEYGYDPASDEHLLLNHWGSDWGVNGTFRMRGVDLQDRLANGGEAWAAVELP